MAGLVAGGLSLIVIVAIAPVLSGLPRAVLSAIVVNAVWKLIDYAALRRYARVRRNDIVSAVVATVGVLAFGPLYGLLLAVAGSLLGLVYRSSRVDVEVMGKVPHEKAAWGSTRNHAERSTYPGVIVLRIDAPIFWVTAAPIYDSILTEIESGPGTRALVLDIEATNQMDTTSVDTLADLLNGLRKRDIDLYLVHVMWPVRKLLAAIGTDERTRRGPRVAQHLAGRSRGATRARAKTRCRDRWRHRHRDRSGRASPRRGGSRRGADRCPQSGPRPSGTAPARVRLSPGSGARC
jgi:SulP family sulfate permease